MTTLLCVAPGCRRHIADCGRGDDCGCPPHQTAAGSRVCGHHIDITREHLRELPEFWAVLGSRPQGGHQGGGSGATPPPISDRARLERQGMRIMLVTWCRYLAEHRGSPLPVEEQIAAQTQAEILRHHREADRCDNDADVALRWWRDPDRVRADPDVEGQQLLGQVDAGRQRAKAARQRAERPREDRETGADLIEALREHLDRHLAWLLNRPEADRLVYEVDVVHSGAFHTAYPSRAALRILCGCGVRVPINTEPGTIMVCPGCGEWGDLKWWRNREAPAGLSSEPKKLRELPQYLWEVHGLVVSYAQLRHWTRPERIGQRIIPARYDPETVALIAKSRLGRRATA